MVRLYSTEFVKKCATDEGYSGELVSPEEFDAWLKSVVDAAKVDGWNQALGRS